MPYAIRIVMRADGVKSPEEGLFVKSFDPDAHEGRGEITFTDNKDEALSFISTREAFACYNQTSKKYPVRPDGKPNKPLTAYTVGLEPVLT